MIITDGGTLVRTKVDEIRVLGRNTQGVTVIRLGKGEKVVGVDRIAGNLPGEADELENGNENDQEIDSEAATTQENSEAAETGDLQENDDSNDPDDST